MAIKMRNNNDEDAFCVECGSDQEHSLNMFDICIGGQIFTICDKCNEELFNKTLHAECYKNGRVKSKNDLKVLARRNKPIRKEIDGKHLTINEALEGEQIKEK